MADQKDELWELLASFVDRKYLVSSVPGARVRSVAAVHWIGVFKIALHAMLISYFSMNLSQPSGFVVKEVWVLVEFMGFIALLVWFMQFSLVRATEGHPQVFPYIGSNLPRALQGVSIYLGALWLIGHFGGDLYSAVVANPDGAIYGSVASAILALMWWALPPIHGRSDSRIGSSQAAGSISGAATAPARPTAVDNRHTAAHEAGHALVYAALMDIPKEVRLVMNSGADQHGALGFITGVPTENMLTQKLFAEWLMLVLLAGKHSEHFLLGDSTLGALSDHQRWLNLARVYLSNHNRGVYYNEPQNEFEHEHNRLKLDALQDEQLHLLQALFEANSAVLQGLADELEKQHCLGYEELIPILSRVSLPLGFPRPSLVA